MFLLSEIHGASTHGQVNTLNRGATYSDAEAKGKLDRLAESYTDRESCERQARIIRAGIRRGMQLERIPKPYELNPTPRNLRRMDGHTVENVAFESLLGYWVSGNLYLPANIARKIPGILNPHGHWPNGRVTVESLAHIRSATC